MGAQLEQTIHLISFLTSPVFLDNIFNEPTTFTSRWEKKNFILSTKDTSTKFGVPVVLENKFSCKVETWFYSDIGHSLHAFRIPTSQS